MNLSGLVEKLKSPAFRKTLATVAGSAGYVALGDAGYVPGADTTAGVDADTVRMGLSVAFAIGGYLLPAGIVATVKTWSNVLGKESANRIDALEVRVDTLEKSIPKQAVTK